MSDPLTAALLAAIVVVILAAGGRLRGLTREFATRTRLATAVALLWAVLLAAVAMPTVLSGSGAELATDDLHFAELFTGHAVLGAFLVAWWRLRRPTSLAGFLHLRGASIDDLPGGIALGFRVWLLTFGVAMALGLLLQLVVEGGDSVAASVEVAEIPEVLIWIVGLPVANKLLIVLAAMTVEEAFFRSFLQTRIGLIPSSVLFAAAHASYGLPTLMIGVFVVSIVIGLDFAKNRQLLRSILAHGVFDAIQLLVVVPFAVEQLQQMQ